MDPDRASIKVIADSFLRFGLQRLTGGKRAFINFTRDTLVKGYATLLPKTASWSRFSRTSSRTTRSSTPAVS